MSSSNANTPVAEEDAWYHGKINKDEAAAALQKDGKEGTFLVRDSTSRTGDYALSVIYKGEVHHFQIWRHGQDAFFSIAKENNVIHGLDELIKFYQSPAAEHILLGRPLVNSVAPSECRRHGRTNLLHRATKEGEIQVVREMVLCGYRSIDAKNEDGQTAAHLASIRGHNDVLKILIEAEANVNAKDSAGQTPLLYGCINNHPDVVRTLLECGKANPQVRRQKDGWVALHEAAFHGHTESIKILLEFKAPLRPRTAAEELPVDLAEKNGHIETTSFLRKLAWNRIFLQMYRFGLVICSGFYRPNPPESNRDDWYHSVLDRIDAIELLQKCRQAHDNDLNKCYYLVRRSSRSAQNTRTYVLTLLFQTRSAHYEIKKMNEHYFIDNGPYLDSLEEVIDHYARWPDGLQSRLEIAACPTLSYGSHQHRRVSSPADSTLRPPPLPKRLPLPSPNGVRHNSISPQDLSSPRISPVPIDNNSITESLIIEDDWENYPRDNIPPESISVVQLIGGGEYGDVYEGTFKNNDGKIIRVAIKTLKDEMNETSKGELLREGQVMMSLEHENIVKLIGISWFPEIRMIQELMELGSLQTYIKENSSDIGPLVEMPRWANQIAKGMVYLEQQGVVHRDLALRNILLSMAKDAKISDFGLSRVLSPEKDYYAASHGGRWPIKWYAPECCYHGTFTHKSDVWSYGITLWEMYSFGEVPYGAELPGSQVIELVESGYRLEKPVDCPDDAYDMIRKCWEENPDNRPTFKELNEFFNKRVILETAC